MNAVKQAVRLIYLLAFFGFGGMSAYACQCLAREAPSKEFRKTPVVFVGTVKRVASSGGIMTGTDAMLYDLRTVFVVEEEFKGVRGREIDIFSSSQGTACGVEFREGDKLLVYAYEIDKARRLYATSVCTRTHAADEREDEIALLRSLAQGSFVPRIYGRVEEIVRGIYLGDRQENRPLAGVTITAQSGSNTYRTVTDETGRFRFVGIRPGIYRLDPVLPKTHKLGDDSWDFSGKPNLSLTVTEVDAPDFITIETRVNGRIAGRVRDARGRPAGKDVRVTLVTRETADAPDDRIHYVSTETDADGDYEFYGLPAGEFYVGLNLDLRQPFKDNPYPKTFYPNAGKSSDATIVRLSYGQTLKGYDLVLPSPLKTIAVRGRVLTTDGAPVVGVTVYVSNQARHDFEDFVWLKTDENGEFTASCLESLQYDFSVFTKDARGNDRRIAEKNVVVDGANQQTIEFRIEK